MQYIENVEDVNKASTGHNGGPPLEDAGIGEGGWIAVARKMRFHPLVGCGKPVKPADPERGGAWSRYEAWQDLIMECRYKAGSVMNRGRRMEIKPGQLLGAISWLAHRWNWTPKAARWFLDQLEAEGMAQWPEFVEADAKISQIQDASKRGNQKGTYKGNQSRVLTICNYRLYQLGDRSEGQPIGQPEGQANGNRTATERQPPPQNPLNSQADFAPNKGTREQGNNTTSSQQQAPDVLAGLNGAAYPMIESIKAWTGMPDANAREWLGNSIRLLGEAPIRQAYQQLDTKIKTNQAVSQPLQLWSKMARDIGSSKHIADDERKTALKVQRDKIRAEMGWKDEAKHG